jgi:hypothetical protein
MQRLPQCCDEDSTLPNLGRRTGQGPLESELFLARNGVTKIVFPHLSGQVSGLSKIVACGIGTRHDHLPFL